MKGSDPDPDLTSKEKSDPGEEEFHDAEDTTPKISSQKTEDGSGDAKPPNDQEKKKNPRRFTWDDLKGEEEDKPLDRLKEEGQPDDKADRLKDDFVDEEFQKEEESSLSQQQLLERFSKAQTLKERGNEEFKDSLWEPSIETYTKALLLCPLREAHFRAVLYGNRAAAKVQIGARELALMDCSKSLELNDKYVKCVIRRAKVYESMDRLEEALEDYKKTLELDSSNREAYVAAQRLQPIVQQRTEKLKAELLEKGKDFANLILRPFGMSTDNFKLEQNEQGSYNIKMSK